MLRYPRVELFLVYLNPIPLLQNVPFYSAKYPSYRIRLAIRLVLYWPCFRLHGMNIVFIYRVYQSRAALCLLTPEDVES